MQNKEFELTDLQVAELKHLANLKDEEINVEDIPEMLDWSGAKRGMFYNPISSKSHSKSK